ncbi:hypothetical protein QOL99_00895 [Deinococcus sp. MIMF12]|uniref:Uncharacterized protein n=1 Tax=Deinococcus rhizophilus TaxID=3049544 RepID=A0ABT7JFI4_9DEIO|nr:hypothetical protein [Deinococcus rhizophilus]MDL2342698.1 hypothetical protein [Deinococcus rhizophilus]
MPREGSTWRTYSLLVSRVAEWAGHKQKLRVQVEPDPREDEVLGQFGQAVQGGDGEAVRLLEELDISPGHFRHHLRYIARWGQQRRRLLSEGGNFQVLEKLNGEDRAGQLAGLVLRGTRIQQERALADHLRQFAPVVQGHGWLGPIPNPGKPVREYSPREVVWVYASTELQQPGDLHPSVARSLIRRYMPKAGIVADPMAGSGTVARMARLMGHRVWASDLNPREPYIAPLDLYENDLSDVLSEGHAALADFVIVHPPTAAELGLEPFQYLEWLRTVLGHCWNALSIGGHVALIVSIEQAIPLVSRAERALTDSANLAFEDEGLVEEVGSLTAQHLAVSRDGRQGWHILVLRRPTLETDAQA